MLLQKKLIAFLTQYGFNSIRLPLNADYVNNNEQPQISYINSYENPELASWTDKTKVRYLDLIGRMSETFQEPQITLLLTIDLLTIYPEDAYWYTRPYVDVTKSGAYLAATKLADTFCNASYWNIIGVELKSEMTYTLWPSDAADQDKETDWRQGANAIADALTAACPQWLVFVGGASSPTTSEEFQVSEDYALSKHWDGGNFHNLTAAPMNVTDSSKIIYAPHAHSHGIYPMNYFYSAASNCSATGSTDYTFTGDAATSECVDYINGTKTKSTLGCSTESTFACESYEHLATADIAAQYTKVMTQAVGTSYSDNNHTMILGSFSGVYGSSQPHQQAALDFLINFAASVQGGYFYALNPDSEYYLEDSIDKKTGVFGRTHYGVFQPSSWTDSHADLLSALAKIPNATNPCYGATKSKDSAAASLTVSSTLGVLLIVIAAMM